MGHDGKNPIQVKAVWQYDYCHYFHYAFWGLVFLLAIGFASPLRAQSSHASSSIDGQALWAKTKYPVVRTLAELRRLQGEVGKQDFEVDLQAQLSFAAHYWNVFFIQDGDIPAMVMCTDAATSILCNQPMGKWLRIRGLVYSGQPSITLVGLELLPESRSIEALRLEEVPTNKTLPLDRMVEMPCRLLEVLDKLDQSSLCAEVNQKFIELHVERFLTSEQYVAVAAQLNALATGTLSPKHEWTKITDCALRMMDTGQLKILDPQPEDREADLHASLEGQVLFSDDKGQVVVGGDDIWRVDTRFAEHLKPGTNVVVWGNLTLPTSTRQLQAQRIKMVDEGQLATSVNFSVGAWEQAKTLPQRVSLEAVVLQQVSDSGLRTYRMRSGNKKFTAIVNEKSDARELYRIGDRIRLTGAPLVDAALPSQAIDHLKLYVIDPKDTQFVSAPVQLSMVHLGGATGLASMLVAVAFSWTWLLRRQVNERTIGLKKVTSHLRMSFDTINEAVLVTDAQRRLCAWNRQFELLFGDSPVENQSIDLPLSAIRRRLQDPGVLAPILRAGETKLAEPVSVTLVLENPAQVVNAFVAGIIDSDGTYHGHLYMFDDVTEKQRLESELIQSQKMEAIGQLSGGVAHDFNNLLTIVSSNLALIRFTESASALEYVDSAETAVRRAAELTQQLLDFSRRSNLEIQVVNLNDLVGRIGMLLKRTFDRSVSLQIELCSSPLMACIDINRIEQVLINICINARDALRGRNGKIIVRVSPAPEDGSGKEPCARIEIEDNGCGMSREVQARIFDPFFTTKKTGEGTGLGLSMAQGVVEQLGGRIYCDSKPDVGTRFRIELPLTELSDSSLDSPPALNTESGKKLRVLLVDDELMVRNACQALLRGLGHDVAVAASGQEALAKLEVESFDVVLLDLTMPTMSGKEAYLEIHARWPEVQVAICTGYFVDNQSWNADCDLAPPKIISKPYSVESLSNYLNSIDTRPIAPA